MNFRLIGCVAAFCCLSCSQALYSATSYHVGNSLTWMMSPDGLSAMAGANGISLGVGYHITFGKGLDYIWDHPEEITHTNGYGAFPSALKENAWDHVTLQPFGSGETLKTDIESMTAFIDLTLSGPSGEAGFYIFETWPIKDGSSYGAGWMRSVPNEPGAIAVHSRQYFRHLRVGLLDHYGAEFPLYIIPIGEVLYELEFLFQDGQFEPYESVFDLFLDNIHLGDIGNWIVVNTVYATLFKRDPTGTLKPAGFYGQGLSVDDSERVQAVVWKVVSEHPHAGVVSVPSSVAPERQD